MIGHLPVKKRLKILFQLNLNIDSHQITFGKISHILSQYNIFESHLVDEFFLKIFKNFNIVVNSQDAVWRFLGPIKVPVCIDIYKKKYKTDINICGFEMSSLFKKLMDRRLMSHKKKKKRKGGYSYSVIELLKINLIHNLFFFNLNSFNYLKFKKKLLVSNFILKSIKNRFYMKARKINFKRKEKKKK